MKSALGGLVAVTVVLASASLSRAQAAGGREAADVSGEPALAAEVVAIEKERLAAGVRNDVAWLEAGTSDRFLQVDFTGRVLDKAATLKRLKSGVAAPGELKVSEMTVRVFGDTAIVTALVTHEGVPRNRATAMRYSRVYAREGGAWRVVHFHQTPISRGPS